jgi:PKD repeat protein
MKRNKKNSSFNFYGICIFLFIFFFSQSNLLAQQSNGFCGIPQKSGSRSIKPNDKHLDSFGYGYTDEDLDIEQFTQLHYNICSTQYFNLIFNPDYKQAAQDVVCAVFKELESTIDMSKVGTDKINILVGNETDHGSLPDNVIGTGSFYWSRSKCGIASSYVQKIITGGIGFYSPTKLAGYITINDNTNCFTKSTTITHDCYLGITGTPSFNQIDFYSVVMHEALHVLGIGSLINSKGEPDNDVGAYSRWDKFLKQNNKFLLENLSTATECCDKHKFNSVLKAVTDIDQCQDEVRFLNRTDLRVSNNSGPSSYSLNTLSHLISNDCITNNSLFVMTSEAPKGKRINLTMAEKEILCAMGYTLKGIDCDPQTNSCTVLANDDNLNWWLQTPTGGVFKETKNITDLLANDIYPSIYTIEFDNVPDLKITIVANNQIEIESSKPGSYICKYRIKGCNPEWCDYAVFTIIIGKSPLSCTPNPTNCEAICYGDFEKFISGTSTYFQSLGYIKSSNSCKDYKFSFDDIQNTPDIVVNPSNDNRYASFFSYTIGNIEGHEIVEFPLSKPILPNCSVLISFDALSNLANNQLFFYGLNSEPNGCLKKPLKNGGLQNIAQTGVTEAIWLSNKGILINGISTLNPNLDIKFGINSSLSFNWTNTTNTPITHLIAFNEGPLPNVAYVVGLDNLKIQTSCDAPLINIGSKVQCPTNTSANSRQMEIEYTITKTSNNGVVTDGFLKITSLPIGIKIAAGSDFSQTLFCNFKLPANVISVTKKLIVEVEPTFLLPQIFDINIEIQAATNVCNTSDAKANTINIKIGENANFSTEQQSCVREIKFRADIKINGIHTWDFGDGSIPLANSHHNPDYKFSTTSSNSYTVKHTIQGTCGVYDKSVLINIASSIASSAFTINQQCSKITCNSTPLWTHSWDFGDGSPLSSSNEHYYQNPGTYKITHTVTNSCGTSTPSVRYVTIDDINNLANFTSVVNICSAVCTSATKTGTHEWIFGDNGVGSNLVDPTYNYSKSGSYNITHIVKSSTCANQVVKTIGITTKCSEFSYTKKTDGCGDSYTFTSQNPSPGTHLWDFGDFTTSNEANPTIMFPKSGTYTIKHTLTINGFSHTTSTDVTVVINRNVLKKGIKTSLQQGLLNASSISNGQQFTVTGIYYIDKDYTFEDCDFFMTEGSGIIINEDIKAEFSKNCTFQACGEKMWRGIWMEKNSSLVFTNNTIEDADYAITLGDKCLVDIKNNIFNANHIGLYTYSTQGSGNPPTIVYQQDDIKNNTFKCDRPLKSNFSPWIDCGDLKCVGLCFNDLASGIRIGGLNTSENNVFTKLDCGIVSKRSDLHIQFADINHLNQTNAGAVPQQGVGIYLEGGYNTVVESNFSDMFLAIAGADDNSVIWKNTISEVVLGMSIADAAHKETYVIDNTINFNAGGIISDQINFPEMLSIEDNTLNHTQNYPTWFHPGIMLSNMVADPDKANIKRSTITMGNDATAKIGIWSWGGKNITIQSNQIKLNNNSSIGIGVSGFGGASVGTNKIKANFIDGFTTVASGNLSSPSHLGIVSSFSPEDFYSCNEIKNTEVGIRFSAYGNNTNFETSVLHNHHRALLLSQDANIGPQDHTGNQWVATNTPFAEAFHESGDPLIINQSQFQVTQGNTFEPNPIVMPNAPIGTQWIKPDGSTSIFCPLFKAAANGPIVLGSADDAIADGSLYDNTTYERANTYEAKHHLFSKLDRIGDLSEVSPNLRTFYENTKNAPLGAFYELQKRVESALKGSPSFRQAQHNHLMSMDSLRANINKLSIQLSTASDESKTTLLAQRKVLNNQLAAEHTATEANYHEYLVERNQALTFIMADINNMEEGNDFILQNEKIFYANYIAILMHNAYYNSRVEWDAVKSLAEQCPFKGGSVVYRARGLYMRKNPNVVYNDDIKCTTGGRPIGKVQYTPKEDFSVSVYPNPANENINIILNKSNNNTVFITLTDILGKVLFNANTIETNFIIDTSMFPSGSYQIKVNTEDNNNVNVSKIIINH